jgi:phage/plasmid-like protein (TIGR03299 family)
MSHELATQEDGSIAMAYRAGDAAPWHATETNPQIVEAGASIDTWAEAAGLNYDVECKPNYRYRRDPKTGAVDYVAIPDSHNIHRTDNGHVTGPYIAGQWQPVQNSSILEMADRLRNRHGFDVITAGALFDGAAAWVQLETDRVEEIGPEDAIAARPLFTVRHTGKDANTFSNVSTRVVCNNTLTFALSEKDADIFRHDHRVELDPFAVETALGLQDDQFGAYVETARRLAARALTDIEALEYFRTVIGGKEKTESDGKVRHSEGVRKALAYYRGRDFLPVGKDDAADVNLYIADRIDQLARGVADADLPDDVATAPTAGINPGHDLLTAEGTLWGAFNTITWLSDQKPVKNRGVEHNIASNLFGDGTGGKLKQKAYRAALELAA